MIAVENKILDVSSLVKNTDYGTNFSEMENAVGDHNYDEYIITPEFSKLAAEAFDARLKQGNVVAKTEFDDELKSLNQKINSNKTKHLLVENEFKSCKHVIQFILDAKVILKKVVHKII